MASRFSITAGLFAVLAGCAKGVPHDGPVATPTLVAQKMAIEGWTPKPTSVPSIQELFRRQMDPGFCGYLEGDPNSALGCEIGASCMYNDKYQWFGCCTGSAVSDCNIQTACVQSKSYSECLANESCANDQFATACLYKRAPYCVQLYTVITGSTYGHFACGATSTSYEVMASTTDAFGAASSSASGSKIRVTFTAEPSSTSGDSSSPSSTDAFQFSIVDQSSTTTTASASGSAATLKGTQTTTSTGGAIRTAEVALGAVGGVAGLLFWFA